MMIYLLLMMLGPPSNHAVHQMENKGLFVMDLTKPEDAPQRLADQGMAFTASGVLYENEGAPYFFEYAARKSKALPKVVKPSHLAVLDQMDAPAFFAGRNFWVFNGERWTAYEAPLWVEFNEPLAIPGSSHGLNVILPAAVQVDDHRVLLYQYKNGQTGLIDLRGGKTETNELPRKMRPHRVGDTLLWFNAPKEHKVGLFDYERGFRELESESVADLDRYSQILPHGSGCWVVTVPSGVWDAKRSWQSGQVEPAAHYLAVDNNRIKKQTFKLPTLPVDFEVGTSSSGSPKPSAHPAFKLMTVKADKRLAVVAGKRAWLVHPESGLQGPFMLPDHADPIEIALAEGKLWLYTSGGKVLPWRQP